MKKGDEIWVRWSDDSLQQCRLIGTTEHGWRVVWLTGFLKDRDALVEKIALREAADRK
jgi:hypothetical protein